MTRADVGFKGFTVYVGSRSRKGRRVKVLQLYGLEKMVGWIRVVAVKVVRSGQNHNTLKIELIGLLMNWKKGLEGKNGNKDDP